MTFQIGHVGLRNPDSRTLPTERCCRGCRTWHDARELSCPMCGKSRPEFNPSWRKPILNDALFKQGERANN